jgi:hypothetical protein
MRQKPRRDRFYLFATAGLAGLSALTAPRFGLAQPPGPTPAAAEPGPIAQYLTNSERDLDGRLLTENTVVQFPPQSAGLLAAPVLPGHPVSIDGFAPADGNSDATECTTMSTGATVSAEPHESDGAVVADGSLVHVLPAPLTAELDCGLPFVRLLSAPVYATPSYDPISDLDEHADQLDPLGVAIAEPPASPRPVAGPRLQTVPHPPVR